ncbi:MAG TPA: MFS transporter, partial [Candidatus Limnocylindria bacterium]|nr:MFS transporter [Candidatus Limnocylindria bacterium]
QAGFGLGAIIGPLIAAAWLAATGQWQGAFLICMGATLAVLLVMVVTGWRRMRPAPAAEHPSLNIFGLLRDARFARLVLTIFLYLGYEGLAPAYVKQHFLALGSGEAPASLMISVFWGTMILARLLGALRAGHELRSIRFYAGLSLTGALLLAFSRQAWLSAVAVALFGFGCGPTWPMLMTLATGLFPQRSGSAVGVMMLGTMAGMSLFPWLIGTVPGNLTVTFALCAVLALLVGAVSHYSLTRGGRTEVAKQAAR